MRIEGGDWRCRGVGVWWKGLPVGSGGVGMCVGGIEEGKWTDLREEDLGLAPDPGPMLLAFECPINTPITSVKTGSGAHNGTAVLGGNWP